MRVDAMASTVCSSSTTSVTMRAVPSSDVQPDQRHQRLACHGVVDRDDADAEIAEAQPAESPADPGIGEP